VAELSFAVVDAHAERYGVSPSIALRVRVSESSGVPVHAIALRAQVQIEPQRRRYGAAESTDLTELFGGPERYGDTLRSLLWCHAVQNVVAFEGATEFTLARPCS